MIHAIHAAIFDLDGTITLTENLHHKAFSAVFADYGVTFTLEEEVEKYSGVGSRGIFTQVLKDRGVLATPEDIEKCIEKKRQLYSKLVEESDVEVVLGVHAFCEELQKKNIKMCVATGNSNLDAVRQILEKADLLRFFPVFVSVKEVARGKPFPDLFLEAARRIAVEPSECIVFEDSINGIQAAKDCGMRRIGIASLLKKEALIAAGAEVAYTHYSEIREISGLGTF